MTKLKWRSGEEEHSIECIRHCAISCAEVLFHKARQTGWRSFTLPADGDEPALTVTFDGRGRYVYERTLFPGFRERVVCDGDNLWHLYPDLHIGAKRKLSRFHRQAFSRLVPMALPRAEDLAHGADLVMVGERTVAVVPHGSDNLKDGHERLHLVFDEQGQLSEQQVVEMPSKKVMARIVLGKDGSIRILDARNKETFSRKTILADANAPDLKPDLTPRMSGGQPVMKPVGSRAVRQLIEEFQPLLALHGHIHESKGETRIGRTLAINSGSEYNTGRLHGVVVTLGDERVVSHQFVVG